MSAISVIIGTFNYLYYLQLCLLSLERQTFKDFEVIVADDGSGPEIGEWLRSYQPNFPVTHLWQENKGFRKCKILNRSLMQAKGDYIVFLDADCIVSKNFLHEHWKHREPGVFLGGRRVMVGKELAVNINKDMIYKGYFDGVTWWGLYQTFKGHFRYYDETFKPLFFFKKDRYFNLLGSNFSIHKADLFLVNGFDEEYEHRGGGEDTDVAMRLQTVGCKMKSVRYLAIQFHLGHDIPEDKSKSAKMFFEKQRKIKTAVDAKKIKSSLSAIDNEQIENIIRRWERQKH